MKKQISEREIRVFLSSTFRDMDAERTYLVKQVFPKVRAACLERQVGFSEIDLRWGVSEEESKNGATVEICLKEIDRCRDFPPFFVGFLGERYGWVPRHDELSAYWEKRTQTDNDVKPVEHKSESIKSDLEYANTIRQSIDRGISVTELEMELAVLGEGAADKIAGHALFCLRDAAFTDALYREQTGKHVDHNDLVFFDAGNGKLAALKASIRQSGYLGLDNYTSIEQFGSAVETYLLAQLDRYFPADAVPSAFERGNAAHAAFRFHRLQNFLPRPDVREQMIQAIEQRLSAPSLGPIIVTGPSGQGKSALMADLARYFQKNSSSPFKGEAGRGMGDSAQDQPIPSPTLPLPGGGSDKETETWRVIDHYIGADNGNHIEGWVERILQTLHPDIQDIAGDIPESPKDKIEALSTWISMAARRNHCRYLFILDALDQLGDGGKNLDILTPQTLGPDGILIASAADGTPARISAAGWQTHIEVPPLTDELRTRLVTDTLARYRKRLPENLARKLAHAPQSGSPLYLGMALEELRVDARYETLDQLIDDILKQPDAEHLFLNNFLLDEDNGRPELPELAASFMALLGAARAGLSEDELADLLAMPTDPVAEDTGKPRMPQVYLSKLLNNFAPFLLNKQGRRAPMHRIFGEVALEYYGTAPVREHLYAHFAPGYGKGDNEFDARGAAEALHQIAELAKLEYKGQKQAREQFVEDLGSLYIPVNLHDDKVNEGEMLILETLDALEETEQAKLRQAWNKEIAKLDSEDAKRSGPPIRGFGNWLKFWARYPLALAILEPLMYQQETLLVEEHKEIANTSNLLGLLYLDIAQFDEAIPLLRRALAIREKKFGYEHPNAVETLKALGELYRYKGDYKKAEAIHERALIIDEKIQGIYSLAVAADLNNLALVIGYRHDHASSEQLYRRALTIREKSLGPTHWKTAQSLNNLAECLIAQGNLIEAEHLHRRCLAIYEKYFGFYHPETACSINNLALLLNDQNDFESAKLLMYQSLAINEKVFGPEHPTTATNLNNLATLLKDHGDCSEAKFLCERALSIREKSLGTDHPDVATSLNNLAYLNNTGNPEGQTAVRLLFERALSIREKSLGTDHPDVATSLNNLAEYLSSTGKPEDQIAARPLYERALAIREAKLGSDHLDTATSLDVLATLIMDQGDYTGAEPLYRRALSIRESKLGSDHLDTATSLDNLALSLRTQGDYAGAETLYRRALSIRESKLGSDHLDTAASLDNLAFMLLNQGDYSGAEPLFRRALAIRESKLGYDHLDNATSLDVLATLIMDQGDYAGAEPLYRRALSIRESKLGSDHLDTATSLDNLAFLLYSTGDYADAEPLYRRALAIREKALGPDHPHTATSLGNLAELLEEKGDIDESAELRFKQLAILEKVAGIKNEKVLRVLQNLAVLLRNSGKLDEAEPLQRESVARHIKVYGENGLDSAAAYSGLGALLKLKGELAEAETYYRKALVIREQELGADAEPTKLVRNRLDELLTPKGEC